MFVFSHLTYAQQLDDSSAFENMEHSLNQQPWQTYQKLQAQAPQLAYMSAEYKLWWLLRKAQAENLLFLLDKFQQTVATAEQLFDQHTSDRIRINFNIFKGIILQRQGRYQQSQDALLSAQQAATNGKYTHLVVLAKQELAYTRSLTEVYDLSLTELQQAYVKAFTLDDDYLIAKINEVYGAIYGYLHDYEKSIEYYQKALLSYQRLGYPSHEIEAIYGLASTYRYWQKFDLAIKYYKEYQIKMAISPQNIDGKFYAAYGIAMSLSEEKNCQQAIKAIDIALNLEGFIDYKAELYKRKADCLIQQDNLIAAEKSLEKADAIFSAIPELIGTHWQIEVLSIRAELTKTKGDSALAYQQLKEFNHSEVALLKKTSSERLLRVRGALELERKNVEISLLTQRAKVQKLLFEQQKQDNTLQTYIIAFSALILLLVLVFVHFQWRHGQRLLALSVRDSLSGLFTRRYVFSFLRKFVEATNTHKSDVSILLIDIDNFKQINDRYGHPYGDMVIREIAKIGQETLRIEDIMGRVGGEEFLCVLPRIDSEQCLHIAQRFVNKVNEYKFTTLESEGNVQIVNVTICIGLATTTAGIQNSDQLYAQADKALSHAKYSGKNSAVPYQDYMHHSYQQHTTVSKQDLNFDEDI